MSAAPPLHLPPPPCALAPAPTAPASLRPGLPPPPCALAPGRPLPLPGFPSPQDLYTGVNKKMKINRKVRGQPSEEIVEISVKPGWKKGTRITFQERGEEAEEAEGASEWRVASGEWRGGSGGGIAGGGSSGVWSCTVLSA